MEVGAERVDDISSFQNFILEWENHLERRDSNFFFLCNIAVMVSFSKFFPICTPQEEFMFC